MFFCAEDCGASQPCAPFPTLPPANWQPRQSSINCQSDSLIFVNGQVRLYFYRSDQVNSE